MATIPDTEPAEVQAGDTIEWTRSVADYSASDGWTLKYALRGPMVVDITATASGSSHAVSVAKATSGLWIAGLYYWQAYVEKGTDRHTVGSGRITVRPNLAAQTSGAYDGRSHPKRVLDAIEAVIEGRASKDQQSYTIHGRSLSRTPVADLLVLRDRYKGEYASEIAAEKIARGERPGGRVLVRFS